MRKTKKQKNKEEQFGPDLMSETIRHKRESEAKSKLEDLQLRKRINESITESNDLPPNAREVYNKYARGKTPASLIVSTKESLPDDTIITVEFNLVDLKTLLKKQLKDQNKLTPKELRSVEFKYMIRDYEFAGIKCEFKKGKDEG